MDKSLELVAAVKEYRDIKDLAGAYAYAFGMLSACVTDEQLQRMIDGLKGN